MGENVFCPNPNPHGLEIETATRPPTSTTQMWLIEMSPICGTHPEKWDKNLTMEYGHSILSIGTTYRILPKLANTWATKYVLHTYTYMHTYIFIYTVCLPWTTNFLYFYFFCLK